MKILDATCGARRMWYQKKSPLVTFMDKRKGDFSFIHKRNGIRKQTVKVDPDIQADWTKELPFKDESFDMVVFDPPHIIREKKNEKSFMQHQYGVFSKDTYKTELRMGILELFRILKEDGTFILKWCDLDKPVDEILKLFPYPPMFGTKTGQRNNVHWIVFIKHRIDEDIIRYSPDTEREGFD